MDGVQYMEPMPAVMRRQSFAGVKRAPAELAWPSSVLRPVGWRSDVEVLKCGRHFAMVCKMTQRWLNTVGGAQVAHKQAREARARKGKAALPQLNPADQPETFFKQPSGERHIARVLQQWNDRWTHGKDTVPGSSSGKAQAAKSLALRRQLRRFETVAGLADPPGYPAGGAKPGDERSPRGAPAATGVGVTDPQDLYYFMTEAELAQALRSRVARKEERVCRRPPIVRTISHSPPPGLLLQLVAAEAHLARLEAEYAALKGVQHSELPHDEAMEHFERIDRTAVAVEEAKPLLEVERAAVHAVEAEVAAMLEAAKTDLGGAGAR